MKMRWVTKFNLGIKQVLIRQSGTALEQKQSEISKKDRPQRMGVKRSDAEGGTEMDAV